MYLNMLIMCSLPLKIKICFILLIDYVVIIKKKCLSSRTNIFLVMGYDVSGTEISERPVRFEGDNFLQFKHRYGRR